MALPFLDSIGTDGVASVPDMAAAVEVGSVTVSKVSLYVYELASNQGRVS